MNKRFQMITTLVLLASITSGCAISPLTRKFTKWSAESLGRATFLQRLGSGIVMFFTAPVYIVTLLLDFPIAIVEFFGGTQLVDDPLVRTAQNDFGVKTFAGNDVGETWEVRRMVEAPEYFAVAKLKDAKVIERYEIKPVPGQKLEVIQVALN